MEAQAVKAIAIVGARLNSSRLPGKHLLDLAGAPMITRIFERLDQVPQLHASILATTADAINAELVDWAQQQGRHVLAYEGDVDDLMGRVDAVVQAWKPDIIVYICGDCPLIEPSFISRAVSAMALQPEAGYVEVETEAEGTLIHQGIDIYSFAFWRKVLARSVTPSHREHVGSARFPLLQEQACVRLREPTVFFTSPRRTSVDTPRDYHFMASIYRRWYQDHSSETIVSLSWAVQLLNDEPELAAINASVQQKQLGQVSEHVILVAAAGKQEGLGHLRRLLVLAATLTDQHSAGVRLLIQGEQLSLDQLDLVPHRFCSNISESLPQMVQQKPPRAIVFDMPKTHITERERPLLEQLAQKTRLVSVDFAIPFPELITINHVPCFYLDPALRQENIHYGWDHYLLDVQTSDARSSREAVLVLTGGSDVHKMGDMWPRLLEQHIPTEVPIIWVQGPYAAEPQIPADSERCWTHHRAPSDMHLLMRQARCVLTLYGVSLFECLAHGLPTVTWAPGRSEEDGEMRALDEAAVTRRAKDPTEAVTLLVQLLEDRTGQQQLSANAKAHFTGEGPRLLAKAALT